MKKILIALSLLLLISCHSKDHKMENAVYDEDGYPLAKRDVSLYKPNPDAKQAYKVKVEIKDAPGPLKLQRFSIHYQADNCRYTTNRFAGATSFPHTSLDVPYEKIAENTYEGIAYLDGMLDEDYYGQGVCRWYPIAISASFKATGTQEETAFDIDFSIDLGKDEIEAKQSIKRFYYIGRYPYTLKKDGTIEKNVPYSGIGEADFSNLTNEDKNKRFTMLMIVEGAE